MWKMLIGDELQMVTKVKAPKATWDAYATGVFCEICKEEVLVKEYADFTCR